MLKVDLHVHSIRSHCGAHTLLELVDIARSKGIEALAITNHGHSLGTFTSHFSILVRRIPEVIDGIRILKGIEANVLDLKGGTDIPDKFRDIFEVVLIGLHSTAMFEQSRGIKENTSALIRAIEMNPCISIVSHPAIKAYPVDIDEVASCAYEHNVALEISNSNILYDKDDITKLRRLVELALDGKLSLSLNSDGHVFNEIGEDDKLQEFLSGIDRSKIDVLNDRIMKEL